MLGVNATGTVLSLGGATPHCAVEVTKH